MTVHKLNALGFKFFLLHKRTTERKASRTEAFCVYYPVARRNAVAWVFMQGIAYVTAKVTVTSQGRNLRIGCNLTRRNATDSCIYFLR